MFNLNIINFKEANRINMSLGKPVIKLSLMEDEMKDFAISEAQKALDISNSEKVIHTLIAIGMLLMMIDIVSSIIYEVSI
jgi:hypothetical protein